MNVRRNDNEMQIKVWYGMLHKAQIELGSVKKVPVSAWCGCGVAITYNMDRWITSVGY